MYTSTKAVSNYKWTYCRCSQTTTSASQSQHAVCHRIISQWKADVSISCGTLPYSTQISSTSFRRVPRWIINLKRWRNFIDTMISFSDSLKMLYSVRHVSKSLFTNEKDRLKMEYLHSPYNSNWICLKPAHFFKHYNIEIIL